MLNLSKKSIGLDIADSSIEVVELIKKESSAEIVNFGRIRLGANVVEKGRVINQDKLAEKLKKLLAETQPKSIIGKEVIFGLPESQIYTEVITLKKHNKKERENLIKNEAIKNIPLEENDLAYSYQVLFENKGQVDILIIAASKQIISEWQQFFNKAGLKVKAYDIEILANLRGVFTKRPEKTTCFIDLGSSTTNLAIFDQKGLNYSQTIFKAGDYFDGQIAKNLKLDLGEAEKKKKGINLSNKNQSADFLKKALDPVINEIKKSFDYWQRKNSSKIQEIILLGGSAKIKGLADYFSSTFGVKTKLGTSILRDNKAGQLYLEAIGLALRGVDNHWNNDPFLEYKELKIKEEKKQIELKETPKPFDIDSIADPDEVIKESRVSKKLNSKIITLIIILIVGAGLIAGAFWYKSNQNKKEEVLQLLQIVQYSQAQSFDFKIPIAVNKSEYTKDRIRGRIIEDVIEVAGDYNEAVAHSRIKVEEELKKGENLWLEPVNEKQTEFPMTIKWVVYSSEDANELFLKEVDKINKENVDYLLDNIEKGKLELSDNSDIFYLNGKVTILVNQLIQVSELETTPKIEEEVEEEEIIEEEVQKTLIKDTPTGWLNVRQGPGTNYSIIIKVNPGEEYILLEEKDNWFRIQLNDDQEGWVYAEYAEKMN